MLLGGCVSEGSEETDNLDVLDRIQLVEELRIGSVSDPDEGFSSVSGLYVVDDTIYIGDALDAEIRVYTAGGDLVRRIGGRGEGPGELRSLYVWGIVDETIWVYSEGGITLLGLDGSFETNVPPTAVQISLAAATVRLQPFALRSDGYLSSGVAVNWNPDNTAASGEVMQIPKIVFDRNGEVADTVGMMTIAAPGAMAATTQVEGVRIFATDPLPDYALAMISGNDSVYIERRAPTHSGMHVAQLTRVTESGDTVLKRLLSYTPRPLPPSFADSAVQAMVAQYSRRADPAAVERAVRASISPPPDYYPPVEWARALADGSIWMRRLPDGPDGWRWAVMTPEGELRGEAVTPPNTNIVWGSGDTVYVVETDEVGVPWVVRYRLMERSAG